MKIAKLLRLHKRSLFFLLVILILSGIGSCFILPVSLFPHVDFSRVVVSVQVEGRPTDLMTVQVTMPIEEAVRSVPGVLNVRSTTTLGETEISVDFEWGLDMVSAMLQVEAAIQLVPNLPPETIFDVRRMDPTVFPVIAYSLTSDVYSLINLRNLTLYQLKPILSTIDGVAKVGVIGGAPEEFLVTVDISKLLSFGLTITDVANALLAENILASVGKVEEYYKLYLLNSDTRLDNIPQILNTVLRSGKDGIVLIEDIAKVEKTMAPHWNKVTADGKDAIIVQIYQQPGQSTIKINNGIKKELKGLSKSLLRGINHSKWYDQSELILQSTKEVVHAILLGVILSSLIIFLFLRNLKVTFLSIITVPTVIATTILLMHFIKIGFNIMTLGGIAAAVGLILDDTIVMIEHIIRRLREDPRVHQGKVFKAAKQFTKPLVTSSIATMIIFLPLSFSSGVTGSFFTFLAITMVISLIISLLIACLVIPIFSDHFLNESDAYQKERGRFGEMIQSTYEKLMKISFQIPALFYIGIIVLIAIASFCYLKVGSGFIPQIDEGGFVLDYTAPAGTSLTETDRLVKQVEGILQSHPHIKTYSRRTGLQLGGGITEANEGDFYVRLTSFPRPSVEKIMEEVRLKIEETIPILSVEFSQLIEDLIGDLTASPEPIEIKLFSEQEDVLLTTANKIAHLIETIPGVVDVYNGIVYAGESWDIEVDRVKASLEGIDPESITKLLKALLSGTVTTYVQKGPRMIGVRVWIPEELRSNEEAIQNLLLQAPDGHRFPLKQIATIKHFAGQPQITRDNLKQMIPVTGRINGRDMGSVVKDVKKALEASDILPQGVYFSLGGLYKEQQKGFKVLLIVFICAVLLIFLLLLFLYDKFAVVFSSLLTTLLAVSAVFIGLWLTSTELNISSLMGLTMIVGIATKMSIFYFSELFSISQAPIKAETFIQAGKNRMRPIAMTSFATILALFPLALFSGMQQPLAIAIISGLIVEFPLVLMVLPVLLSTFNNVALTSSPP